MPPPTDPAPAANPQTTDHRLPFPYSITVKLPPAPASAITPNTLTQTSTTTTQNHFALPPLHRTQKSIPLSKRTEFPFPSQPSQTKPPHPTRHGQPSRIQNLPSQGLEGYTFERGWMFKKGVPGCNMRGIFGERPEGRPRRRGAITEYYDEDEFAVKLPPAQPALYEASASTASPTTGTGIKPNLFITTQVPSHLEEQRKIAKLKKSRIGTNPTTTSASAPKIEGRTETTLNGVTGVSASRPKAVRFPPFGTNAGERAFRNPTGDEPKKENVFLPEREIQKRVETRAMTETTSTTQKNDVSASNATKPEERNKREKSARAQKKEASTQTLDNNHESSLLKEEICSLRKGLDEARKREEELIKTLSAQVTLNQEMLAKHGVISSSLKERLIQDRRVVDELRTAITLVNAEKNQAVMEKEKAEEEAKEMEEIVRDVELLANNLCVGPERQKGPWTDPKQQLRESIVGSIWGAFGHVQLLEEQKMRLGEDVKRLRKRLHFGAGNGTAKK